VHIPSGGVVASLIHRLSAEADVKQMTPGQRKAIAYHEAGHIVAAVDQGVQVREATIMPNGDDLGQVTHHSIFGRIRLDSDRSQRARRRVERSIIVSMAGPAAQRLYCKRNRARSWPLHGGESDYSKAFDIACDMCSSHEAAEAYLNWLAIAAHDLIGAQWALVEIFASALLEHSTLSAVQIRDMAERSR
jgi:Peptidase family M41